MEEVNNAPTKKMFNMRNFTKGVIFVLENAYLESAKIGAEYKLLNCDEHAGFLSKKKRDPSHARPDIAHQCMMTLLDSPLNKAGLMKLYVHTQTNVLIDVNPKIRIPRTFKRFSGLMVQLLHKLSIKAEGVRGEPVLKLVKGPVSKFFPPNATVIGTSFSSENLVDVFEFIPSLYRANTKKEKGGESEEDAKEPHLKKIKVEQVDSDEEDVKQEEPKEEENAEEDEGEKSEGGSGSDEEEDKDEEEDDDDDDVKVEVMEDPPQNFEVKESFTFTDGSKKEDKVIVVVVGAMSHGKVEVDYTNQEISISQYPLSGSVACGKICAAFERFFGII